MSEPRDFIQAYLDGELEADRFDAFQDWLREDPANLQAWAVASFLHHELHDCAAQLESAEAAEESSASPFRNSAAAAKQVLMDADLLATLQQIEDAAGSATLVTIDEDKKPKRKSFVDLDEVSTADMVAVGGYVFMRALKSKAGIGAIAALLGVAATLSLLFIFQGEADSTRLGTPPIAQQQPTHERSIEAVATLTAEQDARWATSAGPIDLTTGEALHPGQRLTLTQGFAELTTNDGAVAILEAPCTIEMIDSPNALRLVSGKLVGIVKTDRAKGFLVRTPHMDITDLGTCFGVAVDAQDNALAEVFTGRVQVQPRRRAIGRFQARELSVGDQIAIDDQGNQADRVVFPPDAFARIQDFAVRDRLAAERGITELSGSIQWSPVTPQVINRRQMPGSKNALIRGELWDHRLEEDILVELHNVGTQILSPREQATIPRGTVIRSYIVTFEPEDWDTPTSISGEMTFEGEILGVIAFDEDWGRFRAVMDNQSVPIFTFVPGPIIPRLRVNDLPAGDAIAISENRRTLGFRLSTVNAIGQGHAEFVRVIVRSPGAGSPPD